MEKLSKEQAQLLKSKIHATGWIVSSSAGQKVFEIIEQLTEKEFPAFDMKWSDKDEYNHTARAYVDEGEICIGCADDICCSDHNVSNYFSFEKFLEYAKHIQEIAEWVKEQECKN